MRKHEEYAAWITDFEARAISEVTVCGVEKNDPEYVTYAVRSRCGGATEAMVAAFPELRRVRGHYDGAAHWWCVAPDGTIIDPTEKQFRPGGRYEEYTGPDPLGKCMNCGDYVWTDAFSAAACSRECLTEIELYYNTACR